MPPQCPLEFDSGENAHKFLEALNCYFNGGCTYDGLSGNAAKDDYNVQNSIKKPEWLAVCR